HHQGHEDRDVREQREVLEDRVEALPLGGLRVGHRVRMGPGYRRRFEEVLDCGHGQKPPRALARWYLIGVFMARFQRRRRRPSTPRPSRASEEGAGTRCMVQLSTLATVL